MFKNRKKSNKKGFFKKVWYSIFKIDKYGEMSAEGLKRAIGYLLKLTLLVSTIVGILMVFKVRDIKHKGIEFLETQVGQFSYNDGILNIEGEQPIIAPSSTFGEIIIDTSIETDEEINKYINSMEEGRGILALKDRVVLRGIASNDLVVYKYSNLLGDLQITNIDSNGAIEMLNSNKMWTIYGIVFAIITGYTFLVLLISIVFNALILSIFGYLVTWFARIKMRFAALFNLSVYSLTLSTILNVIYIVINMLTDFVITYFQLMYMAVAAIYLIASILIIKSDFLRTQVEVAGIVKMSKENNTDENEDNDQNKEEENRKDKDKNEDEKKQDKKKDKDDSDEPEGSQA